MYKIEQTTTIQGPRKRTPLRSMPKEAKSTIIAGTVNTATATNDRKHNSIVAEAFLRMAWRTFHVFAVSPRFSAVTLSQLNMSTITINERQKYRMLNAIHNNTPLETVTAAMCMISPAVTATWSCGRATTLPAMLREMVAVHANMIKNLSRQEWASHMSLNPFSVEYPFSKRSVSSKTCWRRRTPSNMSDAVAPAASGILLSKPRRAVRRSLNTRKPSR
mmetsp:Transcript_61921/g.178236  ORF Transcript_61921/g.178236 Transcript_61921/m.178236 type:complete len:219 (+) Transcript_61921:290-946(+)